jgi:CRP/FNR family transcriptional regulator, cyclic AMP receptor protein
MADLLGYAASCAVLATFLMRTMIPLRLVAIFSNILFVAFGYIQSIHPILFLHLALLPINTWRLLALRRAPGGQLVAIPFFRKRLPNI